VIFGYFVLIFYRQEESSQFSEEDPFSLQTLENTSYFNTPSSELVTFPFSLRETNSQENFPLEPSQPHFVDETFNWFNASEDGVFSDSTEAYTSLLPLRAPLSMNPLPPRTYLSAHNMPLSPLSSPSTPLSLPSTPLSSPSTPLSSPSTPFSSPSTPLSSPSTPFSLPSTPFSLPSTPFSPPETPLSSPGSLTQRVPRVYLDPIKNGEEYVKLYSVTRRKNMNIRPLYFKYYDVNTLPTHRRKSDIREGYKKSLNNMLWTCTLPYFTEHIAPDVDFSESMSDWLTQSVQGQKILASSLRKLASSTNIKPGVREALAELSKTSQHPSQHQLLRHLKGIDAALITPTQWAKYQREQITKSAIGGEKG